MNKIAENSSAFDYAKEAFKALDDGMDKPENANCIIRMQFLLQAYYPIVVIEKVQLSLDKASTIVELPLEN